MRQKMTSSQHSFVGKAATGRWAMLKFKHHLISREFTWITDCSGLLKFFETDYKATHTMKRFKLKLLQFDFTIVQDRPECSLSATCYQDTTHGQKHGTRTQQMTV
jgi:hypothetical protein